MIFIYQNVVGKHKMLSQINQPFNSRMFAYSACPPLVLYSLRKEPEQTFLSGFIRPRFRWITVPTLSSPQTPVSHGNESAQPKSGIGQ
jgi:hypothetical protein